MPVALIVYACIPCYEARPAHCHLINKCLTVCMPYVRMAHTSTEC